MNNEKLLLFSHFSAFQHLFQFRTKIVEDIEEKSSYKGLKLSKYLNSIKKPSTTSNDASDNFGFSEDILKLAAQRLKRKRDSQDSVATSFGKKQKLSQDRDDIASSRCIPNHSIPEPPAPTGLEWPRSRSEIPQLTHLAATLTLNLAMVRYLNMILQEFLFH